MLCIDVKIDIYERAVLVARDWARDPEAALLHLNAIIRLRMLQGVIYERSDILEILGLLMGREDQPRNIVLNSANPDIGIGASDVCAKNKVIKIIPIKGFQIDFLVKLQTDTSFYEE